MLLARGFRQGTRTTIWTPEADISQHPVSWMRQAHALKLGKLVPAQHICSFVDHEPFSAFC